MWRELIAKIESNKLSKRLMGGLSVVFVKYSDQGPGGLAVQLCREFGLDAEIATMLINVYVGMRRPVGIESALGQPRARTPSITQEIRL